MHLPACTLIIQDWLQQCLNFPLKSTSYQMLKVRENASTQDINMCVEPLLAHLHPDTNNFEHWARDIYFYQDQAVGFMMQETVVEGQVILSRCWHKFQETKENLCQRGDSVLISVWANTVM